MMPRSAREGDDSASWGLTGDLSLSEINPLTSRNELDSHPLTFAPMVLSSMPHRRNHLRKNDRVDEMKRSAPPLHAATAKNIVDRRKLHRVHCFKLIPRKSRPQASSSHCEDEAGVLYCWISWPVAEK
ncbi:hypothetical protein JCGZ_09806 [Jatropha curcas]|uniref:Uncharacterized protein n=1 Tax=Jatropha curcas TaxID=180498 RepID=A0A067KWU0_JATCU|nr:hypothetical protein JCGZ_09806 [Jatropha curcas]